MRFEFNDKGHLVQMTEDPMGKDRREPICPSCELPIQWVLDMASWGKFEADGQFTLMHAHCVWIPLAFRNEEKKAKRVQSGKPAVKPR